MTLQNFYYHFPPILPPFTLPKRLGNQPFCQQRPSRQPSGWVLIDRSGRHFGTILNYLRDGSVPLPESTRELGELLGEARYYLVQGLIEDCQLALQRGEGREIPSRLCAFSTEPDVGIKHMNRQKRENLSPLCLIPTVTSPREEQQLLASTSKPVVKLLHNRSNNKYSYTSTSDDNLLKNIELFDKLALRFHGRLLFLKDVLGDEICCWSFYGQGRKIAEVCCTSIVYATEKKQTKVEFPEARIFEETLNILIYETPRGPDPALLEATGGAAGGGGAGRGEDEENREHRVRRIHVRRHITHDERPHGQQIVFKD
ncbi:BTB/POZ domain-containing adapter for CUL3-mediated RhoA degradation protein 1 isoform X3 [Felis catus]|uniref:BTB/POZ domain-containing adapter for CUL3-mediated RhoA degradation protein 1 isoform X3 n=1 Tax=Felis catus TaxID=9685 RepID=UPI001D1A1D4D|nr:BTB/POZ domain-containing adapter for CUL3-mediated RhoA degradation protein 1 isoform X3 [Felis catus]